MNKVKICIVNERGRIRGQQTIVVDDVWHRGAAERLILFVCIYSCSHGFQTGSIYSVYIGSYYY